MKVCDVVCNSIWYDPRVRKQIIEYKNNGIDICAVGLKCNRYDKEKLSLIPCRANIVCIDERYDGKQKGILRKLWREHLRNRGIKEAVLKEKPDVIHANDLDALMAVYPAYKKLKCTLIYDSHEICAENIGTMAKVRFMLPLIKWYEKHMINRLDRMVCVSNAAAEYFAEQYKVKKPMVVTNCSLASEMVLTDKKNDGFEVLNHGQFYGGRGYDIMVEAAPLLKDYPEIKLALRGFGVMENELKNRTKELNADNVIFYPKVRVEELIPEASKSMVGLALTEPVCLNFKLSVSNKLFEYASAGLPVIMSDIPEHRYLNEKYSFGVVLKKDSPEELANAILKLYTDKEFYAECQQNAVDMSREVNWENEFKRLIELERNLVGK
ncbi:MAG: glycosyltransferase [Clostridia bacterium]|nr:glycosyltransferase [Clostridia bacterium]